MKWVKGSISPSSHRLKVHSSQMASSASILSLMKTQLECCQRSKWDKIELELKTMFRSFITASRCFKRKKNEHSNTLKIQGVESKTCSLQKRQLWLKKSKNAGWGQQTRRLRLGPLETIYTVLPFLYTKLSLVLLIGINNCCPLRRLMIQCLMTSLCQSRWT